MGKRYIRGRGAYRDYQRSMKRVYESINQIMEVSKGLEIDLPESALLIRAIAFKMREIVQPIDDVSSDVKSVIGGRTIRKSTTKKIMADFRDGKQQKRKW